MEKMRLLDMVYALSVLVDKLMYEYEGTEGEYREGAMSVIQFIEAFTSRIDDEL